MEQKLIIKKDGGLRGIQIVLSPAEGLVVLDALRKYVGLCGVHEDDKRTAKEMRFKMINTRIRCEQEEQDERE